MKVINIGGATVIFEYKGIRILCDPWMDEGIFHGSWHHYPPLNVDIEDLGKIDYVFISHIHEDHCSAGTIKHLDPNIEIIIADRNPNFVLNFLKSYEFNFKIHMVKPHTPYTLKEGLIIDIVTADPEHELNYIINAGLIIEWDSMVIYNANDCAPYKASMEYILGKYGNPDIALLPYATGSSYPPCFSNLSHEEKMKEKTKLNNSAIDLFISFTKILNPKYVMPFADQYVIVGSNFHLNQYMPHPSCPGKVAEKYNISDCSSKLLLLNSGQSIDLKTDNYFPNLPYKFFSDEDRDEYSKKYSDSKYDHELFSIKKTVPLLRMLKIARENLWNAQERINFKTDYKFYIFIDDWKQRYLIPLNNNKLIQMSVEDEVTVNSLSVKVSSTLLYMLLTGHISWNIADAALFLEYKRLPNIYDPKIHSLWNYIKI